MYMYISVNWLTIIPNNEVWVKVSGDKGAKTAQHTQCNFVSCNKVACNKMFSIQLCCMQLVLFDLTWLMQLELAFVELL